MLDWPTVIAQIVNFLILVVLLWLVLYKPIIRAMDQRRDSIETEREEARRKQAEADQLTRSYRDKEKELEDQRTGLLRQAEAQAEERRRELQQQARTEVDRLRSQWEEELRRQQDAFLDRLRRRAGEQVCAIARRTLADLSDSELERRMVETFVRRLGELEADARRELAQAARDADGTLTVVSAFEMPDELAHQLTEVLNREVLPEAEVQFETSEELVCGIQVKASGREVSWTVAGYLQDLTERLAETFAEELHQGKGEAEAQDRPATATASGDEDEGQGA